MRGVSLLSVLAIFAAVLAFAFAPSTANAHEHGEPKFASACHAASGLDVSFEQMTDRTSWTCTDSGWRADQPVAWVWFDAKAWAGEERPRYFFTRIARYKQISFAALDADGSLRTRSFTEADGRPFAGGPVFQLELPEVRAETRAVLMRVERPHSVPLLAEARLAYYPEDAEWSQLDMMVLALVIGMLILPLFFDISFFIVLREKFVALHAVMVASMIIYVAFAGGLVSQFTTLPVAFVAIMGPLFWAIGCGVSALFLATFLERGAQSTAMRRLTIATGYWTIFVPGFFALQLHATQPVDDKLYFVTFIPAMVIITAAIVEALMRGSMSARFLAVAWGPIILCSLERMLRGFGLYTASSLLDQTLYVAAAFEVLVISLAIAVRFLAIRRERDEAVTEARMLEKLSEHDALTGLMNRRAVESRFAELRLEGFDTFAVLDLDHFKNVNDMHGHQVGDQALIACANAIRGNDDRDSIAVRLGGEEFVILMRGERTIDRLEALRQLVPVRIARDVEALDRPVTASIGVIELPRSAGQLMNFNELYARADQLLYEAKATGRNRMCFERLTVFDEAPQARPRNKAAA